MSHLVTIQTKIKDPVALAAACRRLGLAPPIQGEAQLYAGQAMGLIVNLPGWTYPVVVDTAAGVLCFDNFRGAWGSQSELDKLLQAYAIGKCRIEARKACHTVTETPLADGSIKLTISVGGGMTPDSKTIEIIVSLTGQTRIQTHGFAGSACKDATRAMEQALGLVESDQATGEMHSAQQQEHRQSQRA